ncbi:endothelin-converting enzyme 1-like isoform X3 [Dermacentor albipictus]|uniref:endothelin-converting enzyme 1-like isoform X3 n=1 Tax=Dermacentor albipictus TaxID=60249 RepID=UPI0038FCEC94
MPDAGEGDPNMMPMEGMPPQDQNWMDYALELNPYRKTIEVFLMLSMLTTCLGVAGYCILSYLIVEYFFGSGGLLRAAETAMEVCTDNACGEYEHRTMGFVDWKGSPCENYFKYACSGFQKEAVDLNFAVYRPHNEVIDIEYDIISELLFQDGSDQWPSKIFELHKIAKEAYRICRATEGFHADLVRELYSAKSRGVSYVISKFEQLHPIWPFYTPVVGDMKCYLFPPEMFVPVTAYKNEDLMDEFAAAYMNHLKDSGLDETPEVRNDIDFFLNVEKTMAKLSTHPKRRLYKPIERTSVTNDIPKFLSADIVGCKDKPYVWADEDHYKGVKEVIDKMDNSSLTLYIIMWSIQTFSIAGKENTPLARLHYRYVELLNNPPPAERRCIDYLEPMLRQYYLDHLRVAHVYLRDDLPRTSQLQATQAMQRLVTALKGFLQNSALDELDVAKATSMLDGVKFELFYPGKLDDPGFSDAHYALAFAAPSSAAGGQRLDAFRALVGPFISRAPELNMGWPIPSFSYDPVYMPGIDTIYVPYPVFAWAYMHSRSKLPFSIPVYGLKLLRELFKAIDYRAQWWVGKGSATEAAYQALEDCVQDIEQIYQIAKEPVERYETIAEIAAVHVLYKMYTAEVHLNKENAVDVRLPFLRTVHSTTQFFVALASEMCARTDEGARNVLKTFGVKTAEQRMELLANHMPQYTEHFGCQPSQRMHVSRRYKRCLFWRR